MSRAPCIAATLLKALLWSYSTLLAAPRISDHCHENHDDAADAVGWKTGQVIHQLPHFPRPAMNAGRYGVSANRIIVPAAVMIVRSREHQEFWAGQNWGSRLNSSL